VHIWELYYDKFEPGGSHGTVIAIEAESFNFEISNPSIKLNLLSNVIAWNDIVYSNETKIKLYLIGENQATQYSIQ
jgi:hypothetical protein